VEDLFWPAGASIRQSNLGPFTKPLAFTQTKAPSPTVYVRVLIMWPSSVFGIALCVLALICFTSACCVPNSFRAKVHGNEISMLSPLSVCLSVFLSFSLSLSRFGYLPSMSFHHQFKASSLSVCVCVCVCV
jgi:hypothetical protein